MELELPSDGGECKGGRVSTVGPNLEFGEKSMESLEKQTNCVVNSRVSIDGCAQSMCGFIGDGDGVNSVGFCGV